MTTRLQLRKKKQKFNMLKQCKLSAPVKNSHIYTHTYIKQDTRKNYVREIYTLASYCKTWIEIYRKSSSFQQSCSQKCLADFNMRPCRGNMEIFPKRSHIEDGWECKSGSSEAVSLFHSATDLKNMTSKQLFHTVNCQKRCTAPTTIQICNSVWKWRLVDMYLLFFANAKL